MAGCRRGDHGDARTSVSAELTGCRLHVAHISTAGAVELVRAGQGGRAARDREVTPHHLFLDEDAVSAEYDTNLKMNPPLRSVPTARRSSPACSTARSTASRPITRRTPRTRRRSSSSSRRSGRPGSRPRCRSSSPTWSPRSSPTGPTSCAGWPQPARPPSARRGPLGGWRASPTSPSSIPRRASRSRPSSSRASRPTRRSSGYTTRQGDGGARGGPNRPSQREGGRLSVTALRGASGARRRHGVLGLRLRRERRGRRRAVLQHLDVRLPGGPHRPELRRPDRHDDHAAHRQLRRERRRHGVARRLRARASSCARCATSPRTGAPRSRCLRSSPSAASSPSRASTRAGSRGTCASRRDARGHLDRRTSMPRRWSRRQRPHPGSSAGTSSPRSPTTEPYRVGRRGAAGLRAARRHRRPAGESALPRRRDGLGHQVQHPAPAGRGGLRRPRAAAHRPLPRRSWRSSPTGSSSPTARATRRRSTTSTRRCAIFSASKPVFGICLGHQMLSLAVGARDLQAQVRPPRRQPAGDEPAQRAGSRSRARTTASASTSARSARSTPRRAAGWSSIRATSAPGCARAWPRSSRSRRVRPRAAHAREPQRHDRRGHPAARRSRRSRSQYHPEAAPGPHDARYLFGAFTRLMDGRADYLNRARSRGERGMAISSMLVPVGLDRARRARCCATSCGPVACSRSASVLVVDRRGRVRMEAPVIAAEVDRARERLARWPRAPMADARWRSSCAS